MKAFKKFHRSVNQTISSDLRPFEPIVENILKEHQLLIELPDEALQQQSNQLIQQAATGINLNELLPKAYAIVKETCRRILGLDPYKVQLIAGIALHHCQLVEMQTGEGKTLAAVFPVYLNALCRKGVQVLTFNDYLAKRDAQWMGPVYEFLGLSVGYIQELQTKEEKKLAYHCDITYTTAKNLGFDYLRSCMAYHASEELIPPFHYAIIDEADAILIDESRHPLVQAGQLQALDMDLHQVARFVAKLVPEHDFTIDEYRTDAFLSDEGIKKAEQSFGVKDLHDPQHQHLLSAINQALHAQVLLTKDVDYITKGGVVKLIDEFTGRVVEDRKWRDGLQAAVEAKEGLKIQSDGNILNAVTLQHLLQKYPKIAGMTATAQPSSEEFSLFYGFSILIIPPNKPSRRIDHPDMIFSNKAVKERALIAEIKRVHLSGQPLLIGTLSVKESEELAKKLTKQGIKCQVLNARNDELEAAIIARAGCLGAVTISTNMAGRGTDIILGAGDPEERKKVIELGGLYIIGTNRHESLRIDQQLRGRAGRQGDVGETRFFISFEDELLLRYKFKELLPKKYRNMESEEPIVHKTPPVLAFRQAGIAKFIRITQRIIENRFFDLRRALYEFSDFVEKQRMVIFQERQHFLTNEQALEKWIGEEKVSPALKEKCRQLILLLYDRYWASHLEAATQTREGIYIVQFGGQNPLREFRRICHENFQEMDSRLDQEINEKIKLLLEDPGIDLSAWGLQKPKTTWTYIVQDPPYGNKLALMLLDNSNIGFTADPFSALLLFVKALMDRRKRSRKKHEGLEKSH